MSVIRVVWIVLVVVTGYLGIDAATSSMWQITSCEIGLYSQQVPNLAACNAPIRSYFGTVVVPVLAVPVAVCLIPVLTPRHRVAWLAVAALFVLSVVGFFALFLSSKPTWVDLYGFFWPAAILSALATGLVHLVDLGRPSRSFAP